MKKYFTLEEFMNEVGINNRSRLHQIINGYSSKGYEYKPVLEEGKDFVRTNYIFFPSAIKKIKDKSGGGSSL
jgi:hypothetical protein